MVYRYPIKLAGFWTAQSLWGWIVLLPVTVSQVLAFTTSTEYAERLCVMH
jgi:hypothetical protein